MDEARGGEERAEEGKRREEKRERALWLWDPAGEERCPGGRVRNPRAMKSVQVATAHVATHVRLSHSNRNWVDVFHYRRFIAGPTLNNSKKKKLIFFLEIIT